MTPEHRLRTAIRFAEGCQKGHETVSLHYQYWAGYAAAMRTELELVLRPGGVPEPLPDNVVEMRRA